MADEIERKRVTLHPLKHDGTIDLHTNLYPKTFLDGIVDRDGNPVDIATQQELEEAIQEVKDAEVSPEELDAAIATVNERITNVATDLTTEVNNVAEDVATKASEEDLEALAEEVTKKVTLSANQIITGQKTFAASILPSNSAINLGTIAVSNHFGSAYINTLYGSNNTAIVTDNIAVQSWVSSNFLSIGTSIPAEQVPADWEVNDPAQPSYIKNKPDIPAAQVNADWNATTGKSSIFNKPAIPSDYLSVGALSANTNYTSGIKLGTGTTVYAPVSGIISLPAYPTFTQVQADWNATTGISAILNKPTLGTAAGYDSTAFLPSTTPVPNVGGTNDGTNWLTITLNNNTYAIPQGMSSVNWGNINGNLSSQTDLQTALDSKVSVDAINALALNLAPAWISSYGTYKKGDVVLYTVNNCLYECIEEHTAGNAYNPTNTTYWKRTTLVESVLGLLTEEM